VSFSSDDDDWEDEAFQRQVELNRQMFRDRDSGTHPQREQLREWIDQGVSQRYGLDLSSDGVWSVRVPASATTADKKAHTKRTKIKTRRKKK